MTSVSYEVRPETCSARPIRYDPALCIGCCRCVSVCQCDVLFPPGNGEKTPTVMYPGECYYCGACVMACPVEGAITLSHPLMNRARFLPVRPAK